MSLDNYSELQTAIENWLDKTAHTARVPEFIELAEAKLNRDLRVSRMEQRATANTVGGQMYYAFPSDYRACRNIQLNTSPKTSLRYMSPQALDVRYSSAATGQPRVYSIVGGQFQLAPTPSGVFEIEISYYQTIPDLATNSTNWLLTAAPDLYLSACLMVAFEYTKGFDQAARWLVVYERLKNEMNAADKRDRWSGAALKPVAI